MRTYKGYIYKGFQGVEKCEMQVNGFWIQGGKRVASYIRTDKPDNCQYFRSRTNAGVNLFYIETVD